jgi:DNA-binding transcriptional regulator GbsR (MarR family)
MATAIEVSDAISNLNEQLEAAAKAVGRSEVRRKVFSAIYYHKAKRKTLSQIVQRTNLPRLRVLQEARHLARKGVVRQVKEPGGREDDLRNDRGLPRPQAADPQRCR